MKEKIVSISKGFLVISVIFFFLINPAVGLAANWTPGDPILPNCGVSTYNSTGGLTGLSNPCGWRHLIQLASNLLQFMLYVAVPIAAIAFAWAGWLFLSSRGDAAQITKARGIFLNVLIGVVVVLSAWLLVDFILDQLVETNTFIQVLNSS